MTGISGLCMGQKILATECFRKKGRSLLRFMGRGARGESAWFDAALGQTGASAAHIYCHGSPRPGELVRSLEVYPPKSLASVEAAFAAFRKVTPYMIDTRSPEAFGSPPASIPYSDIRHRVSCGLSLA